MKVAVVEGDGIGKEVVSAALKVLDALSLDIEEVPVEIGYGKWKRTGKAITEDDFDIFESCDCIFFGAITTPPDPDYKSVLVRIRQKFDLYANIRPIKGMGVGENIDFTIVRENTEGMYSGVEQVFPDAVHSTRVITRRGSERIAEYACSLARGKRLTIVHKANILKSCRLFRDVCIGVADRHKILWEDMLVDAVAHRLVLDPERFELIVTTNLFGDILSDMAAALIGGLGLCASANIGEDYALFEPVHGSAPDIAGKGLANPVAAILSLAMMLKWFGRVEESDAVHDAVSRVLAGGITTPDLGGRYSTAEVAEAVAAAIEKEQAT
ncbi:MAG TPA: NAD-dependent isocitrate dehydrogenase [Methanosarcinales archaeon]|nr:NAD-dependent isocitrate dehydrogenase [Methanosarcinales archaeon]